MEVSARVLYLLLHKPPYQIWSISKLNSLFTVTQMTILSTCMEVSITLSCLSVHEPPQQTAVVCCNPVFFRGSSQGPPYQVPASEGLAQAHSPQS